MWRGKYYLILGVKQLQAGGQDVAPECLDRRVVWQVIDAYVVFALFDNDIDAVFDVSEFVAGQARVEYGVLYRQCAFAQVAVQFLQAPGLADVVADQVGFSMSVGHGRAGCRACG